LKKIVVIPARLESSRFPNKILLNIHGLPMIEHVRRRVLMSKKIKDVYVATCDSEIRDSLLPFGAKVIMTSKDHSNGTSRVAEAILNLDCDKVILVQGDEPLILPRHIDIVASEIDKSPNVLAFNATGPIHSMDELNRHSIVKCSVINNNVLYCYRKTPSFSCFDDQKKYIRKMFGIIAYEKNFLIKLNDLDLSIIEETESIEQMRIIENGFSLRSISLELSQPSINEPHELEEVLNYIKSNSEQQLLLDKVLNFL
jgi:3-deoxy-manno-octulosonate cytidylyltransferase (CMP-KDO synthetase)